MLRKFGFFHRLFLAFLLTGTIPVVLLSTVFMFLSGDIMEGSYKQQSQAAVKGISAELDELLEKYRHIVYRISRDQDIISAVEGNKSPDRSELLFLYRKMYTLLSGHIDHASLHIISLTKFPSISTQQVPVSYLKADAEAGGGIFALIEMRPEKAQAVFNTYINDRGDYVMISIGSAVRDSEDRIIAYAVLDVNKAYIASIAEQENSDFFSQLLVVDPRNNLVSDLSHSENDGNFSRLPFLASVKEGVSGLFSENDRMIVYKPLNLEPFMIAGTVPLYVVLSNLSYLLRITLWLLLFCIVLAVLLSYLVSRSISVPVHKLTLAMGEVEAGNLSVRIPEQRNDELGLLYRRFNIMTERIEDLVAETKEEQTQLRIAERKALQAQINPHFLYNTLNTIKSIAKLEGVDKITTIATRFGKILRNSIENDREMISLRDSLELVESYLEIQKIRYGDRLSYRIDVPAEFMEYHIPKLVLQPLVENAVVHGLEEKVDPGFISVSAADSDGSIIIRVYDDGVGMSNPEIPDKEKNGGGIGLFNVHRRIELLYGKPYGISIRSAPGQGTEILVRLPAEKEEGT